MRRLGQGLTWIVAFGAAVAGCSSRDITLKPPKHPEEIVIPPETEAKFSKPPQYPAETLNQDAMHKSGPNSLNSMPNMNGMGGMGGMGRGMGGMGGMGPGMGGMGGMGR